MRKETRSLLIVGLWVVALFVIGTVWFTAASIACAVQRPF